MAPAAQTSTDFWDSLPDAGSQQVVPQAAASDSSNFWDSLPDAPPSKAPPVSMSGDIAKSGASGIAQGFLGLSDIPKHTAQLAAQSITRPAGEAYQYLADKTGLPSLSQEAADYLTYPIENPNKPTATDILRQQVLPAAIKAETGANINYEPKTKPGEYTQRIGQFAPFMLDPEAGITKTGLSAVGSQAGQDIGGAISNTPEAKEVGSLAGMVAGGMLPDVVSAASRPAIKATTDMLNKAGYGKKALSISPDVQATQAQVDQAVQNVKGSATNPDAILPSINNNPGEVVPGSKPTLAEMSPDVGLAQYQDAMRTNNVTPFQERTRDQNTARAQALTNVRGEGEPVNLGEYFANRLQQEDAQGQAAENAARAKTAGQGMQLGSYGELPSEGATADIVQNAQGARKEAANSAWKVLDPYQTSSADISPLRSAAIQIHNEAGKYGAQPLEPAVTAITQDILKPPAPESDNLGALQRFRSSISDAQRQVVPGGQSMRYLQILKNGVDKGIENTVNGLVDNENKAVTSGQIAKENTLGSTLISEAKSWYANRNAGANTAIGNLANANAGSGYKSFSRAFGAEGETGGQSPVSSGDKGVSPAFGAEQKQQYETARGLTFRHETLSRLENSGAVNPDGTLDADKYDRWYQKNKGIFKSNPEFGNQLTNWRDAQEQLNQVRGERAEQQRIFQTSRAAALIKNDPVNEVGRIFGSKTKDPVREFSDLVDKVKGDKDALNGLKAAVGDHILNKVGKVDLEESEGKQTGRIGRQQSYRDFIKQHKESLKVIYGNQLQDLENVASDIKRTQDFNSRAKIAGQSNTTKDAIQAAKQKNTSVFGRLVRNVLPGGAAAIGSHFGPAGAAMGATLGKMSDSFASKGLNTIKAIEQEMMLHPSTFGKAMLEQVSTPDVPLPIQKRIASSIIRSLPQAGINNPNQHNDK